jgi:hypothetical protein
MNRFIEGREGVGEVIHSDKDVEEGFITRLHNSMIWIGIYLSIYVLIFYII